MNMDLPPGATPEQIQQMAGAARLSQVVNPNERKLYVGNLDPRVDEQLLFRIFSINSPADVVSVKILQQHEKTNFTAGGLNYGFIEFRDHQTAENALMQLNGKKVFAADIRVNWAHTSTAKDESGSQIHIFVGDLSPEVTDQLLAKAFSAFGSMSEARVMWDSNTGKSRGYGFVAFREKKDAEQAIASMNGEWLGSRPIRVNWANQKTPATSSAAGFRAAGRPDANYESILNQTPQFNTTVYIGNITPTTTQLDILPLFSAYGFITEVRIQADKGFAFVKLDTHENAAMAIASLHGTAVNGRQIKCSWGRDRGPEPGFAPVMPGFSYQQPMPWFFNQAAGNIHQSHTIDPAATVATPTSAPPAAATYAPYGTSQQQQYWDPHSHQSPYYWQAGNAMRT
ncbi:hypothetical protein HDU76_012697 [Blyttiomyces sp. JEL0837]|nr:hypothetical protein HDU76_012697 [Blyttiomyces sp. JEL0837]